MANNFDFEAEAPDSASTSSARIKDAVRRQSSRLGTSLRKNVVAPLREQMNPSALRPQPPRQKQLTWGLARKVAGRNGITLPSGPKIALDLAVKLGEELVEDAESAHNQRVSARNSGVDVGEFSQLSGALRMVGADEDSARSDAETIYTTINDAANGENEGVRALLDAYHVQIERNKDGSVNAEKTFSNLTQLYPVLPAQRQKGLADSLGFGEHTLALLRQGNAYPAIKAKAKNYGFNTDPTLNGQLDSFHGALGDVSLSWEGLMQKGKNALWSVLLSDGSVADGLTGFAEVLSNGPDSISLSHALGLNRGKEAEQLRWGYNNPEFYRTLSGWDKFGLDYGMMTDGFREKYAQWQSTHKTEAPLSVQQKKYAELRLTPEGMPIPDSREQPENGIETPQRGATDRSSLAQESRAGDTQYPTDVNSGPYASGLLQSEPLGGGYSGMTSLFSNPLSSGGDITQQVAEGVRQGMSDSRFQIELTLINAETGRRSLASGEGAAIALAMQYV